MENRIRPLDESTINKIAAGEVIERPASVVKELIENSIDANATDIRIEVEGGGATGIRIVDDGDGMTRDDLTVSFLKHTTSKIGTIDDIESVETMGFRGEALASITAVSKVEIVSMRRNDSALSGTKISVHGGELISIEDTGAAIGTSVHVKELFYNTPARRKYLKAERTELSHIIDIVTHCALAHTDISFTFTNNGKNILRSPATGSLFDTIVHIYGADTARNLMAVDSSTQWAEVTGFISRPDITRSDSGQMSYFINRRGVSSRALNNAVRAGYHTLIPKNRYPVVVLDITLNPLEVDVNVHPTKREVRLSHEKEVSDAVAKAVRNALEKITMSSGHTISPTAIEIKDENVGRLVQQNITPASSPSPPLHTSADELLATDAMEVREPTPQGFKAPVRDTERRIKRTERQLSLLGKPVNSGGGGDDDYNNKIRILGQVDELYIIAQAAAGLVIIDQHAAHERILYEQVKETERQVSQELISPVTITLGKKEMLMLDECIPYLEDAGFKVSEFGPDTYAVTAVPVMLGRIEDSDVVYDIISDILAGGRLREGSAMFDRVSKSIACRGAIKAGASCTAGQMEGLVRQLYMTKNPYTCPHGRPTMVSFGKKELDKMFKRA